MSVQIVRSKIETEKVGEVKAASERMFTAINEAQPEGLRYASFLAADGETFFALVQLDDGVENPIPGFSEFQELLEVVEGARAEPAAAQEMTLVGSYRLF